ncbi:hypothetical protein ACWEFL_18435 [Streptomyces sp. NPDC004838]
MHSADAPDIGRAQLLRRLWEPSTSPESDARIRNFFCAIGLAAQQPEPYQEFIASLADWTTILHEQVLREGLDDKQAADEAHLLTCPVRACCRTSSPRATYPGPKARSTAAAPHWNRRTDGPARHRHRHRRAVRRPERFTPGRTCLMRHRALDFRPVLATCRRRSAAGFRKGGRG